MELDYCSELELSFQMKVKVWRKTEEGQNPSCLKDSVNFLHSVTTWVPCNMLAVVALSPPCFIKFKVNTSVNQEILEHFSLPSFIEKLISFSSRTQHSATVPRLRSNGLVTVLYCAGLARRRPWKKSHNLSGTVRWTWETQIQRVAEGHYQSKPGL